MNAQTPLFECPTIEPVLERIECMIDHQSLSKVIDILKAAKEGSEHFRMRYFLRELQANLAMASDMDRFVEESELDPQVVINRFNIFGDALEITLGLSDYLIPGLDDNPTCLFSIKARRAIEDAIVGNLALYGLYSLLRNEAEAHQEAFGENPETQGDTGTEAPCSKHVAWRMMSGDWRDELVSIHGPDGLIASGLTVNQATAIIAAHGGVSDSSQQGGAA
ncbi:hypothetical protein [Aeromonas allosaccharophila]|uniref:hypothetical protein n=1 Tax=Aeromonas allosaccharophila TaxID=656 RepID=UPI00343E4D48